MLRAKKCAYEWKNLSPAYAFDIFTYVLFLSNNLFEGRVLGLVDLAFFGGVEVLVEARCPSGEVLFTRSRCCPLGSFPCGSRGPPFLQVVFV